MKLDDYGEELVRDWASFRQWWISMSATNPDQFPLDMSPGEWDEQFQIWDPEKPLASSELNPPAEPPFLTVLRIVRTRQRNPQYGDDRICRCGYPYWMHFDPEGEIEAGIVCHGFREL